jgi:hypothetical protein
MAWPPKPGEPLPRAAEAIGVQEKLVGYSLNMAHREGGPKARGFARILGITIADADYLKAAILNHIRKTAVRAVHPNPPYGYKCVVEFPLRGLGEQRERMVELRTAWEIIDAVAPPRLVTAYLKP